MKRILRLSNGAEYPLKYCGEDSGVLWFEIETDMPTACAVFSDRANLSEIVDTCEGHEDLRTVVWAGYDRLIFISDIGTGGFVKVGLKKGADE